MPSLLQPIDSLQTAGCNASPTVGALVAIQARHRGARRLARRGEQAEHGRVRGDARHAFLDEADASSIGRAVSSEGSRAPGRDRERAAVAKAERAATVQAAA